MKWSASQMALEVLAVEPAARPAIVFCVSRDQSSRAKTLEVVFIVAAVVANDKLHRECEFWLSFQMNAKTVEMIAERAALGASLRREFGHRQILLRDCVQGSANQVRLATAKVDHGVADCDIEALVAFDQAADMSWGEILWIEIHPDVEG